MLVVPINPSLSQSIPACNQFTTKQTKSYNLHQFILAGYPIPGLLLSAPLYWPKAQIYLFKWSGGSDEVSVEVRMLLNLNQHKTWENESKTNPSNVSVGVIARHPLYFPYLKKHLTSSVVEDYFSHLIEPGVQNAVTRWVQRVVSCDFK